MYRLPFENLEKADKEEVLTIIQETKNRLTELRDIMEHPDYKCTKCPSELTMYKCERDFLNMAINRYFALGGEYKYDDKELSDIEFNDKLEEIVKISLRNGCWYEYNPNVIIEFSGEKIICKNFAGIDYVEKVVEYDKESFLYELGNLHIGEWDEEYSTEHFNLHCLDGTAWELQIEYKDGTKRVYFGNNAYPYNFNELLNLLGENEKEIE